MKTASVDRDVNSSPLVATSALGRLAVLVLHHRRIVMITWLIVVIFGGMAASGISNHLSFEFSLPGQPGYETGVTILKTFGNGGVSSVPSIVVVALPAGETVNADATAIATAFNKIVAVEPKLRVLDYANTHDKAFLTRGGTATFAYVFEPEPTSLAADPAVSIAERVVAAALPHDQVGLTGLNQLASGGSTKGPGVFVETVFGGIGALAVLAFVFASLLALIPLMIAIVSILATFLVILALSYVTEVSFIVEFLVALVGLGIAIDYSLLIVTRWREEREKGMPNEQAVVRAVETAGRAVMLSGLTVAVGLISLVVIPVPSLRSTGYGGMLIPLVSILVILTLLPAVLGGIGPRADWPRIRHEGTASRAWSAWAGGIIRHRLPAAGIALVILTVALLPAFGLKVGETSASALAKTGSARVAYDELLAGGVPSGILTPLEVLTKAANARTVMSQLQATTGISAAVLAHASSPTDPASYATSGTRDGLSDIIAIPKVETVNNASLAPVRAVQAKLIATPGYLGVTGLGPIEQDYTHAVFSRFPLMFAIIALLTFLLLARSFRSVVLAGKAVILNLLSLAATFGVLTWFWQEGHGSKLIFSIPATGAITFWIPVMVFAFLFGLSMDYEVFILSRVREEYDRTGSTDAAVVEGLGRTGRLVTSAALILFLAFASLASAPDTDIKVLATGLGVGILLDATVVRALLVPALVATFGKVNWWMPNRVARLLLLPKEPVSQIAD